MAFNIYKTHVNSARSPPFFYRIVLLANWDSIPTSALCALLLSVDFHLTPLHPPSSRLDRAVRYHSLPLSPEPRKLPGWPAAPSGSITPLIEPFHYWRWVVCTAVWDKSFNRFLCALQFSCASRCERTITVERVDQSDVVKALFTMEIVRMGLSGSKSAGSLCLGSF